MRLKLVSESGKLRYAFASRVGSYLSASDKRVHFGLGQGNSVRLLEITSPSGAVQRVEDIKADQVMTVRKSETR